MTVQNICKNTIKVSGIIVNFIVLSIIIPVLAYAVYALWDSEQIYSAADKSQYAVYKPSVKTYQRDDNDDEFNKLQKRNPDVIAWLDVFGTHIDYPVAQGKTNLTYLNTNIEGEYSLAGSIFMDSDNVRDFSEFNTILYGHHMDKNAMFGDIGNFLEKEIFDSRRYGSLFYNEKEYGIEFFAFVHTDAYDWKIYFPGINEEERKQEYIDYILSKAMHKRDADVGVNDRLVLLSTCSARSTNGRDILVGKITDKTYEDPFLNMKDLDDVKKPLGEAYSRGISMVIPWWLLMLTLLLAARLMAHIPAALNRATRINRYKKQVISI